MGAVHELIERDRLYAGGERVEPENARTTDVIYPFIEEPIGRAALAACTGVVGAGRASVDGHRRRLAEAGSST